MPFKLYRNGALINSNATSPYIDTGLTNGQQYSYQVSEYNSVGEGPKAGPILVTPTGSLLNSRTVTSIIDLKNALLDNSLDQIILQNGTYVVAAANLQSSTSLFIGSTYAARTRPIIIKAQTDGGVILSGNNAKYFGGITFTGGSHHQEWRGFVFANGEATSTGVIQIGSANQASLAPGSHHITLRNITFANTLHGYAYSSTLSNANDHAIYFSDSFGGSHDILIDGMTVQTATNPLHSALHFYTHGYTGTNIQGAWNVTVNNLTVNGTHQAVMIWDSLSHDITIDGANLSNTTKFGVRYERGNAITLKDIVTTNSGQQGFYSSLGSNPSQVTFNNCNFDA